MHGLRLLDYVWEAMNLEILRVRLMAPAWGNDCSLVFGLIADRFFPSQIVMAVLFVVGGILLLLVPSVMAAGNGDLMVTLLILNMLCFMPTSWPVELDRLCKSRPFDFSKSESVGYDWLDRCRVGGGNPGLVCKI